MTWKSGQGGGWNRPETSGLEMASWAIAHTGGTWCGSGGTPEVDNVWECPTMGTSCARAIVTDMVELSGMGVVFGMREMGARKAGSGD